MTSSKRESDPDLKLLPMGGLPSVLVQSLDGQVKWSIRHRPFIRRLLEVARE